MGPAAPGVFKFSIRITCPSFSTALFLDEELISVGCLQFGQEALIAALSATLVTLEQLEQILKQIECVLSFLYGSVVR